MRLKRRARVDNLQNDVRRNSGRYGRWLYLAVVCGFFLWIFDTFVGEYFYFSADGLVVQDRTVMATQFSASVDLVSVEEGTRVATGQLLARVRSQSVEESIATLSADLAEVLTRTAEMTVRREVIDAVAPVVDHRLATAKRARKVAEKSNTAALYTTVEHTRLIENELLSLQTQSENTAARRVIDADLPRITGAVTAAQNALDRLTQTYANGEFVAPVDGIVGYLHVSEGSVVKVGEPLMEVFHGRPYILAYIPEGTLYELRDGDEVSISVGFNRYDGVIREIRSITSSLPAEFQAEFRQVDRARIARVEFAADSEYPSLFARTRISSSGWPPRWLARLTTDIKDSLVAIFKGSDTDAAREVLTQQALDLEPVVQQRAEQGIAEQEIVAPRNVGQEAVEKPGAVPVPESEVLLAIRTPVPAIEPIGIDACVAAATAQGIRVSGQTTLNWLDGSSTYLITGSSAGSMKAQPAGRCRSEQSGILLSMSDAPPIPGTLASSGILASSN